MPAGLGVSLKDALELLGMPSKRSDVDKLRKRLMYHGYLVKGEKPYLVDLPVIEQYVPDLFVNIRVTDRDREKLVRSQVTDLVKKYTQDLADVKERLKRLEDKFSSI